MDYFRPEATWLKSTVSAKLRVPFKDAGGGGAALGTPGFALGDITSGAET